ncbi:hypothetical protein BDP81DRAFT_465251 [Colletotrichum phormii]|uniref:RING-type domain-containing protein n=1 Tax=Colletotrichum phormii TaxID=359342 RepID=A0AAI9ZHS4_9PEZI|nr:uncharacterized protein BDP81DRAFT_465251 [Colletotrichum phormii]KAK1623616.1 hypothetical protein BDP81DRAFT_465251 [Colletotrichum phormii]
MCINLWRRYYCTKPSGYTTNNGETKRHPLPDGRIHGHRLVKEEDNVYRENTERDFQEVPYGKLIHWVNNLVRCAHLHAKDCTTGRCRGGLVQIMDGECYFCTGNIDAYFESPDEVLQSIPADNKVPGPGANLSIIHTHDFIVYRENYLRQLLRLTLTVLSKPFPVEAETREWEMEISSSWPEIWCKLLRSHIGHGVFYCQCKPMNEEWRVNPALAMRKNEATYILENMVNRTDSEGTLEAFAEEISGQVFDEEEEAWDHVTGPTDRALQLESLHDDPRDWPGHQMAFVALSHDTYSRRMFKLKERAERARDAISDRGSEESQKHPSSAYWHSHKLPWLGKEDWSRAVWRRYYFLCWLYNFLALDAGLDEDIMMYIGGGLLAVLNPWPNPHFTPHASHPDYLTLDNDLAAYDLVQECVYWVEHHWPIVPHSFDTVDHFRKMLEKGENIIYAIERNTTLALADMRARNRSADARTHMYSVLPEQAVADGTPNCNICMSGWEEYPNHEPVMLPCCSQYVGRKCLKSWLALRDLRGAPEGRQETEQTWAAQFSCPLCRQKIGPHFSPNIRQGGMEDTRDYSFYGGLRDYANPEGYWDNRPAQWGA